MVVVSCFFFFGLNKDIILAKNVFGYKSTVYSVVFHEFIRDKILMRFKIQMKIHEDLKMLVH